VVSAEEKPSQALRRGRNSSMRLAIDSVAAGDADGVVSAGNTGALMAMSKFVLRTLPGIDRPAIAGTFPTVTGRAVVLDLGANVDCDANNLVQFAVMGAAFARTVLGMPRPKVGLLNVGEEELKGNDTVRLAAQILRNADLPMNFFGFIEGDDITMGTTDVVVVDGFTGNIALKTAEGSVKLYAELVREAFGESLITKIGFMLAGSALRRTRARLDPRNHNGGVFLGLNGISVKSHGGADKTGFASAVGVAADMAENNLKRRIIDDFKRFGGMREQPARAAAR
jgi:glycerol-3-phosphate acyltransferase PlsX